MVIAMLNLDLTSLGYAIGRLAGATRFASPEIRKVAALATVSDAWRAYRRDAGPGDVGTAHEASADSMSILLTDDPRRDAVVLWLATHGVPAIADAATTVVRMVNATRGFEADALALLNAAQDAVAQAPAGGPLTRACGLADLDPDHPLQGLARATTAVDRLITTADFAEAPGHDAILPLPSRSMRHYVASEPAGCWALNLALVASGVAPSVPGIVPRAAFRLDQEDAERSAALIDHGSHAALGAFSELERIEAALVRGRHTLAGLSRNARARDAWALIVAAGPLRRIQLARALSLSRAGADIQADALARAGLVTLAAGGRIQPTQRQLLVEQPAILEDGPLALATADFDASMADIDRLLERSRCLVPASGGSD
jgi:hypothetical protein